MANTSYQNKKEESREEDLNLEDLSKVWDEWAKIYDNLLIAPVYQQMASTLLDNLVKCQGGIVHDGGCGTGYWFQKILEKTQASKLIATDISAEMLEKAKKKVLKLPKEYQEKIEFYQMDLTKDWPNLEFDIQIFQFFNYLPHDSWKKVIQKSYDTTKNSGYVYSSTLIANADIKKGAKEHTLEQLSKIPAIKLITSAPAMLKAPKVILPFEDLIKEKKIILPTKDEYVNYYQNVGFKKVEILGEIFWGMGITVRAFK